MMVLFGKFLGLTPSLVSFLHLLHTTARSLSGERRREAGPILSSTLFTKLQLIQFHGPLKNTVLFCYALRLTARFLALSSKMRVTLTPLFSLHTKLVPTLLHGHLLQFPAHWFKPRSLGRIQKRSDSLVEAVITLLKSGSLSKLHFAFFSGL